MRFVYKFTPLKANQIARITSDFKMDLKNLFQPQSFAHATLCSFLVIPKFGIFSCGNKSSVHSLHLRSTKALFSSYIKITGESQLCM